MDVYQIDEHGLSRRRNGNSIGSMTNSKSFTDERRVSTDSSVSRSNTTLSSSESTSSLSYGSKRTMVSSVISLSKQISKGNWDEFIMSKIVMLFRMRFSMVS